MDTISAATSAASSAQPDTVQGNAALMMLKKATDMQASSAAQLIAALPQTTLATSGSVGTLVHAVA